MTPGAVSFIVNTNRFWKYWHGQDIEVCLAPAPHVHVHVLASVLPAQRGQRVVGPHDELVVVTVSRTRRSQSKVQQVQPQLTDWLLAVVADREIALRGHVRQRSGVAGGGELKLNICSFGSTGDHLGHDGVVQREATTGVALVGVKLNLENVTNGLDLSWWRLAAVFGGCSANCGVSGGDHDVVGVTVGAGGHVELAEGRQDLLARRRHDLPLAVEVGGVVVRVPGAGDGPVLHQRPVHGVATLDAGRKQVGVIQRIGDGVTGVAIGVGNLWQEGILLLKLILHLISTPIGARSKSGELVVLMEMIGNILV